MLNLILCDPKVFAVLGAIENYPVHSNITLKLIITVKYYSKLYSSNIINPFNFCL